jgi:hypothetical protein
VSGISANNNPSMLDASLMSTLSVSKSEFPAVFSSIGSKKVDSGGASPFSSVGTPGIDNLEIEKLRQQLASALAENKELQRDL